MRDFAPTPGIGLERTLQYEGAMVRALVLCPETGQIEEVDYEPTDLGVVVVVCSTRSRGADCTRCCARAIDIGARRSCVPDDEETTRSWSRRGS
jgi:hypothetical protein